jgi:hypothetical protein
VEEKLSEGGMNMSDVMTKAEIETQFVGEWILVEDPETDEAYEVLRGRVICHSKDRDEVYREAVTRRPSRFAVLYTGTLPPDMAVVL